MNLQFFTAQLFCVRLFSSLQLWHCPTDSVRAHIEATTKPCPDHPPPVHTLFPRLAKNHEKLGRKRSSMPAYCCSSPHKIPEVPTNAQKLVLTRTYYLFLFLVKCNKLGLCNGLFNCLSFLIPKLGGHVRLVCEEMLTALLSQQHRCFFHLNRCWITKLAQTPCNVLPKADYCQNDYNILRQFGIAPNKITCPIFCWWMSAQYLSFSNH